ncbi:PQQ-like beta-propeller repeat protein [bacterium]|nr:PQQ-like beta-propeller repeat protein [bacterium]
MRAVRLFTLILLSAFLVLTWMPRPVVAQDKGTSREEMDPESRKAYDKAYEKTLENVLKTIETPEFWARLLTDAVMMPPVKERPVTWQMLTKKHIIKDMRFLSPDRLLINYVGSTPVLVDTAKGEIAWKFVPEGWLISYFDIVAAFSDLILIREDEQMESVIAAIDPDNGKQLWFRALDSKKSSFQFLPVPAAGVLLVVKMEKKRVALTALDLMTGSQRWQKEVKIKKGRHPTPPLVTLKDIWHFYSGIRRLDPASGGALWERTDVLLDSFSPPPDMGNGVLMAIDGERTLHALDPDTGETMFTAALDPEIRYTNIHPAGERVYLRGTHDEGKYAIVAIERKNGRILWSFAGTEPTVSNIIEDGDRLYVSTPSTVLCLDRGDGRQIFASPASQTGQTFPVRLRKFGNRLVYVGELVIAGFDAVTGKRVYFKGMTPLSQEAHLDALDNWVSLLEARIKKLSGMMWLGGASGAADAYSRQSEISQNLSNQYTQQANSYAWRSNATYNMSAESDYWKSANMSNQATIESGYSAVTAQLSFFFAMEGMKNSMLARAVARDQAEVSRLQRIRESILAAYTTAEGGEYAYRPHQEGDSVGVTMVHLPTGRSNFTPLAPATKGADLYWNDRSMWNLIDPEKGLVYHHGLRIMPDKYQDKPPKEGLVAYGVYLVAEEIKLP